MSLPHEGRARWLVRARVDDDGVVRGVGRVPLDHALVTEGTIPGVAALELGAQAASALLPPGGEARPGRVVGLRDVVIAAARVPAGEELTVTAKPAGGAGGLLLIDVTVAHHGAEVARGRLMVMIG